MICYAVIDTNVLVSALLSKNEDSATVQILEHILSKEIIPIYNTQILQEYQEVLHRKKFHFPPQTVDTLILSIKQFGIFFEPTSTNTILPDMKDLPFYEIIMSLQHDDVYLITGNTKHFPYDSHIVTARELLDIQTQ